MNISAGSLQGQPFAPIWSPDMVRTGPSKRACRFAVYSVMIGCDLLALFLTFAGANLLLHGNVFGPFGMRLAGIATPIFMLFAVKNGAYALDVLRDGTRGAIRAVFCFFAASVLVLFVLSGLGLDNQLYPLSLGVACAIGAFLLPLMRIVPAMLAGRLLADNPLNELVIFDGSVQRPPSGCTVLDAEEAGIRPDLSDPFMLDRLGHMVRGFDKVTVACPPERRGDWALVLRGAAIDAEIRCDSLYHTLGRMPHPVHAGPIKPLPKVDYAMKRTLDIMLVLPAIIFLAPLLIMVAVAIKLESRGSALFVQQRLGYGNRLFRMYKFRSMRSDVLDHNGGVSASREDDRITRVGRFIRATSIDELPQLFNILNGTMSLVGPRPHALGSKADSKLFWEIDRNYWLRHACMPGLTGLAQVRGFRGATLELEDLENRLAADLEYVQRWTLWLDIAIIFRTFGVVVHRNAF